jgi:hypothetical protein
MEGYINSNTNKRGNPENKDDQAISNSTNDTVFSFGVVKESESGFIDITQLSNAQLIKMAEECTEGLDLERAVTLYDDGLRRFPNDTIIMDAYTDLLL